MRILDAECERVRDLLTHDIGATIGVQTRDATIASRIRGFSENAAGMADGVDDYTRRFVDDVQQYLHDTFVDTTWPKCPRHPHHPLWFRDGWWWCERETAAIAKLGELG
jgi:hypothetical protein